MDPKFGLAVLTLPLFETLNIALLNWSLYQLTCFQLSFFVRVRLGIHEMAAYDYIWNHV